MRTHHSPSTMHETRTRVDMMIRRDAALVLRDRGQRHLEATCMTNGYQNIYRH
jgi:hypothetical protein